jgi:hypothetical protein
MSDSYLLEWLNLKSLNLPSIGEALEKLNFLSPVLGGCGYIKWHNHIDKDLGSFLKI